MPTTEEQHIDIQGSAESQNADELRELAKTACMPGFNQRIRELHDQTKKASASDLNEEESQAVLDMISEAMDTLQVTVTDAEVALNELQARFTKTDTPSR